MIYYRATHKCNDRDNTVSSSSISMRANGFKLVKYQPSNIAVI